MTSEAYDDAREVERYIDRHWLDMMGEEDRRWFRAEKMAMGSGPDEKVTLTAKAKQRVSSAAAMGLSRFPAASNARKCYGRRRRASAFGAGTTGID